MLTLRAENLLRRPCRLDLSSEAGLGNTASPFDRALHVARAEPLFQALARWLGVSFDVIPLADHAGTDEFPISEALCLNLQQRATDLILTVHLPWPALGSLPPIPGTMAETIDIRLAPLPAICRVARLTLPEAELTHLTPGALLLLPESFDERWRVNLVARGVTAEANLEPAQSTLAVSPGTLSRKRSVERGEPGGDGRLQAVDVVLNAFVAWDPVAVLGGGGSLRIGLPARLADSRFRCLIDEQERFIGHIARVGEGYGFFVREDIDDMMPQATAPQVKD